MPVLPDAALFAAGQHDQAHGGASDRALRLGHPDVSGEDAFHPFDLRMTAIQAWFLVLFRVFAQIYRFNCDRPRKIIQRQCGTALLQNRIGAVSREPNRLFCHVSKIRGICHGSPLSIRREHGILSVTDNSRGRVDDDDNDNPYVGFPTVFVFAMERLGR
jgi:hypothetical protein